MEQKTKQARTIAVNIQDEILGNKQDYQKQIDKLKAVYLTLEIGDFIDTVLIELINSGPVNILKTYEGKVNAEIDQSGIKSSRMKEILKQGYKDAEAELLSAHQALLDSVEAKRKELASQKILTNGLVMNGFGFGKTYGFSTDPKNSFKTLTIGINSWISTTDGKSWSFQWSNVIMKPNMGDVYLYAKCPANNGLAKLLVSYEPLPNTPTDYLILMKHCTYNEINF